jgi:hypothetical protein
MIYYQLLDFAAYPSNSLLRGFVSWFFQSCSFCIFNNMKCSSKHESVEYATIAT